MTDPASRLAEIEARLSAATPGPWKVLDSDPDDDSDRCEGIDLNGDFIETDGGFYGPNRANAEFIAQSPDDVRWLVDQVKHLQAELRHAHPVIAAARAYRSFLDGSYSSPAPDFGKLTNRLDQALAAYDQHHT